MTGSPESAPQQYPSREEVLKEIATFAADTEVVDERGDEHGPYLLEVRVVDPSDDAGSETRYRYQRQGDFGNKNDSAATTITVLYIENGHEVGGNLVATWDPESGEWKY